ncbi:hypothetical protein GCM10025881_22980 [Pseudolysinimonas kribbensis]|uniref:ABC transmembrane type-1 domain-containing protein n=1 Tax=Pseudolysinimonas kribbensis TaxID=433641 RepID=A0ABQ6K534_9MICO|nr:carbohydrate ABC transporter permease [Pseudolysinimonas kribbensis]GMA95474.1 hypothetical protein GCM10025881_22980 [Pseudolysinimonas kribbensis]
MTPARRGASSVLRYVALIAGALVMVTPFVYMLSTSFQPQAYVLSLPPQLIPNPATIDNYTRALTTEDFALYFVNSIIVTAISTFFSVLISSMMAFAFARFQFRFKETIFRVLLAGLTIPAIMLLIPQFVLAKNLGILDSLGGLIVFYVAGSLSFNTFLLRGFLASMPGSSTRPCRSTAPRRGPATRGSPCRWLGRRSRRRRSSHS